MTSRLYCPSCNTLVMQAENIKPGDRFEAHMSTQGLKSGDIMECKDCGARYGDWAKEPENWQHD